MVKVICSAMLCLTLFSCAHNSNFNYNDLSPQAKSITDTVRIAVAKHCPQKHCFVELCQLNRFEIWSCDVTLSYIVPYSASQQLELTSSDLKKTNMPVQFRTFESSESHVMGLFMTSIVAGITGAMVGGVR